MPKKPRSSRSTCSTPRAAGVEEIRIPSERAFRERARNRVQGIEIDRKIYDRLLALAAGLTRQP